MSSSSRAASAHELSRLWERLLHTGLLGCALVSLLVTVGIVACTSAAALTRLPLGLHAFQLDMMQAAVGLLLLAFMMVLMLME